MTYSVKAYPKKSFILIKVRGGVTRDSALIYTLEAHTPGKKTGIKHYLLDLRKTRNIETAFDNYDWAYKDTNNPEIAKTACLAMIVRSKDHSHDFIETFSRNAGNNVTLFRNF